MTSWPLDATFCLCGRDRACEKCGGRGIYVPERRSRLAVFTDGELVKLWDGLTESDGIRYGIDEDTAEYPFAREFYDEAVRRGLNVTDEYRWEHVV